MNYLELAINAQSIFHVFYRIVRQTSESDGTPNVKHSAPPMDTLSSYNCVASHLEIGNLGFWGFNKYSFNIFVSRNIDPQVYMSKTENRGKRGVFHLYNMLYCATGCDPLSYKGYGCYCGFLGEGRPTDGIDR